MWHFVCPFVRTWPVHLQDCCMCTGLLYVHIVVCAAYAGTSASDRKLKWRIVASDETLFVCPLSPQQIRYLFYTGEHALMQCIALTIGRFKNMCQDYELNNDDHRD